ncbi:MAG: hypothetical protein L0211_13120 [Planctomycetaceae bacterium]|nr:hypothetical protein [Planctomycetaceae bacterium]
MNAILLTVIALTGGGDAIAYGDDAGYSDSCDEGGCQGHCLHGHHGHHKHCDWLGPMPQSCYNPSFGCYASTRFMHRYPAFHGYYYRSAYNYRHYFDYPWHAGLHEPTSHFSYNTPSAAAGEPIVPPPPAPEPAAEAPRPIRSARVSDSLQPTPARPRTLRR